ncbi:hypothetical protein D3C78_1854280 [compost metagenome]
MVLLGTLPNLGQLVLGLTVQGVQTFLAVEGDHQNSFANRLVLDCHGVVFIE